jgi:hypothetical protein
MKLSHHGFESIVIPPAWLTRSEANRTTSFGLKMIDRIFLTHL